jgi:hypothetical protein
MAADVNSASAAIDLKASNPYKSRTILMADRSASARAHITMEGNAVIF